jgi:hypothetical protein
MSKELRDALAELVAARDVMDTMINSDATPEDGWLDRYNAAWAAARAALAQSDAQPDALAADNFEWSSLYNAVSHMMASLGAFGSLRADEIVVERVMDALHRLDAGQFVPGLTPRAALAQSDAQPWAGAAEWLRNHYQDHANIADLCDAMLAASPQEAPAQPRSYTDKPERTGVGDWCAPGPAAQQKRLWVLRFEDADRREAHYQDEDSARQGFARAEAGGWNCHLFTHVPRAAQPPQEAQPELGDRFMEILRAIHGDMPDAFADSARLAFVHALKLERLVRGEGAV